jgi:hypothetical protein
MRILFLIGQPHHFQAKGVQQAAAVALGSTDCSSFVFEYSGDPLWLSEAAMQNVSATSTSRYLVNENYFHSYYNVTYPNQGMLGCYCIWLETSMGQSEASKVEFHDPYVSV